MPEKATFKIYCFVELSDQKKHVPIFHDSYKFSTMQFSYAKRGNRLSIMGKELQFCLEYSRENINQLICE